jgi:hypothetical protein
VRAVLFFGCGRVDFDPHQRPARRPSRRGGIETSNPVCATRQQARQASAGGLLLLVVVPSRGHFGRYSGLRRYDLLFAADELICGFGRTGEYWGSQVFGIEPDYHRRRHAHSDHRSRRNRADRRLDRAAGGFDDTWPSEPIGLWPARLSARSVDASCMTTGRGKTVAQLSAWQQKGSVQVIESFQ